MGDEKRKMMFFEVGQGKFVSQAQAEFEQAQITAMERNQPIKVVMELHIAPPDDNDPRFGQIGYVIKTVQPPIKSRVYTTDLDSGVIVNDGADIADLLQGKLDLFPEENEIRFKVANDKQ